MSEPFFTVQCGDNIELLRELPDNFADACVTDGPYGIGFMGREWDTFKPGVESARVVENKAAESDNPNLKGRSRGPASSPSAVEYDRTLMGQRAFQTWTEQWAREMFRVLKPGAHLVSFGAPRSHHRMMSGIEDAGFEMRDCLAWLFGQGFPKSLNLHDEWEGWGTALKPAFEPIALARKPFKGTLTANVQEWGTGALNIAGTRIGTELITSLKGLGQNRNLNDDGWKGVGAARPAPTTSVGRWPAAAILDESAGALLDAQTGILPAGGQMRGTETSASAQHAYGDYKARSTVTHRDSGGASRFFYCPKVSRSEREFGCEQLPARSAGEMTGGREEGSAGLNNPRAGAGRTSGSRNAHPTVKPIALMRWLTRLVTPPGGLVIDPFLGSGSTGIAAVLEGFNFMGYDKEQEWVTVADARITAWLGREKAA
jgi:DNA modification methylase